MWFVGSNLTDFGLLTAGGHLGFWEKFFRRLVSRVNKYVHAKYCPNRMSRIQMRSRNVICGVKFDRLWTFDRRRPSWILRKMKNSSAGLFLGSSCMSMPNLVQIRWTGSKLLQKPSFCSPSPSHSCDKTVHRTLWWELKKVPINSKSPKIVEISLKKITKTLRLKT